MDVHPVVRRFLADDGTLTSIPAKREKRLLVLDHVVQSFGLGTVYTETEVNGVLRRFHPDVAALRRYLIDDQFLTRREGRYWRSGGTVDLESI